MHNNKTKWATDIFLFDNLKLISIFAICLFHASRLTENEISLFLSNAIIAFAVPIFAFTSGFNQKNLKDTSFFKKTLCLYLAVNILYIPLYLYEIKKQDTFNLSILITGPSHLMHWYIIALLGWKLITPYVMQLRHPLISSIIFSIAAYSAVESWIAYESAFDKNNFFHSIRLIIRTYPFYLLGVITTREHLIQLRKSNFRYLLIAPAALGFFLCGSGIIVNSPVSNGFLQSSGYILFALLCSTAVISMIPGGLVKHITPLGQKSLGIYIFNILIFKLVYFSSKTLALALGIPYSPLNNSLPHGIFHITLVCSVFFLSSHTALMTPVNRLTKGIESLLFTNQVKPTIN